MEHHRKNSEGKTRGEKQGLTLVMMSKTLFFFLLQFLDPGALCRKSGQ